MMLEDSERLLGTIEQVLRAGQLGAKLRRASRDAGRLRRRRRRSVSALARTRHHLPGDALTYRETLHADGASLPGARRRGRV